MEKQSINSTQQFFSTDETAKILHIHPMTLAKWRREGRGPICAKIGSKYLYSNRAITDFFNNHINMMEEMNT